VDALMTVATMAAVAVGGALVFVAGIVIRLALTRREK
jgi:hypothetical protein